MGLDISSRANCSWASTLIFYKNIFNVHGFRVAVYIMPSIVFAWTISYFFANLFTRFPITPLIEPFYGNKCINVVPTWLSVVITDLIVDVGILLMPVPMVLRLQLPWKDRLVVLGMFGLGASVYAISATRIATLVQVANEFLDHYNDLTCNLKLRPSSERVLTRVPSTDYTPPVFYWTNIDMAMAVVSACLTTLRPIWLYFRPPPLQSMRSDYSESYGSRRTPKGYTKVSGIGLKSLSNRGQG